MKKLLLLLLASLLLISTISCSKAEPLGTVYAQITMESGGVITLELDGDTAPITVGNFVKLAEEGVYDGTIFHRVMSGFMIQGGDPTGTGFGDPTLSTIKGEFSSNGVENNIKHERGVISMARSEHNNSATSQFFICHSDSSSVKALDGLYASFGRVIAGMDVVDEIAKTKTNKSDRPTTEQKMVSVRIIDKQAADAAVAAEAEANKKN